MIRRLGFLTNTARRRRLVVGAVGALVLVGLAVGLAWRVVWPALALAAAESALDRNDLAAARADLDCYLARWPGDEQALLLAARAARRSDACADAERLLTEHEQAFKPSDASRLEWALLGAQQGDLGGDEDRLKSYVDRNHPDTLAILEALAKGYVVSYRRQEAILTLNRLLDHSPDHVPALLLRGKVYDSLRKADEAEQDVRRAVEHAPESAAAQSALAGLLNRGGHTREAIYHYELAQRSRPADSATLLELARAFTDDAQLDEAERRLDELLAADPDHADGLVERGRLALRRGRFAAAEPFLARAVRAAPWHRDGQQLHVIALKELGRNEAASQGEARLAELRAEDGIGGRLKLRARNTPGEAAVRWDLWLWSLRNGEREEGLAWLTEILRAAPGHAQAHAALADYFDQAGQPRRAALHRAAATQQSRERDDPL
jgi:Tfp pilus assembly protein PilF